MEFKTIETKTVPTVYVEFNNKKSYLHSKYDPIKESTIWVEKEIARVQVGFPIIIIGIAAGYHVQALAKKLPSSQITVLEFNEQLYNWFVSSSFYENIKDLSNVQIKLGRTLSSSEIKQLFETVQTSNLLIHKSGIDLLPEEFYGIKMALDDLKMQQRSLQMQEPRLIENFQQNILLQDEGIRSWKHKYKGIPMILVSAGPSLDKQLPLLKKVYNKQLFIIGAVGTALKPLLKAGIIPHFFLIIDPNPATLGQLENIKLSKTPLFYMSSAYYKTVVAHEGPRYIVYQQDFSLAEKLAKKSNHPLIKTGGSVATALLDLMVYFGGETIALIGQDLAYTDGKTHAEAAHAKKLIEEKRHKKYTLDYYRQSQVVTADNLLLYKKWLESFAVQHPTLNLLNCTEGGAYINNWQHITFDNFLQTYKHKDDTLFY